MLRCRISHSSHLSTSALPVSGALDDTWQIQQLDPCVVVVDLSTGGGTAVREEGYITLGVECCRPRALSLLRFQAQAAHVDCLIAV